MGYDRGDSFHLDFEPNGNFMIQNRKENRYYMIISYSIWKEMEI